MTHELEYTLTRDDEDIDLLIEYAVSPYRAAQLYGPPEHCSPAEGGEITELEALRDGNPFPLTADEQARIEAFIYDHHDYDEDYDGGDYWED